MASKRCSPCGIDWPPKPDYVKCPVCLCGTSHMANGKAIPTAEAELKVKEAKFDRMYEEREEARIRAGEPTPEEKGVREARQIVELERGLNT